MEYSAILVRKQSHINMYKHTAALVRWQNSLSTPISKASTQRQMPWRYHTHTLCIYIYLQGENRYTIIDERFRFCRPSNHVLCQLLKWARHHVFLIIQRHSKGGDSNHIQSPSHCSLIISLFLFSSNTIRLVELIYRKINWQSSSLHLAIC